MKFHPLSWRTSHPYVLVDRFEDITPPEQVHANNKCDRKVTLYGYLRGCNLKKGNKVCSTVLLSCLRLSDIKVHYNLEL
jgi:ribosome biogenesis protein BMS1